MPVITDHKDKLVFTPDRGTSFNFKQLGTGGKLINGSWHYAILAMNVDLLLKEFPTTVVNSLLVRELIDSPLGFYVPDIPAFHKLFRPYQNEATSYLVHSPMRGSLLALSPGLGKTAISLVAAQYVGYERILVVAPKSLLLNWYNETKRWTNYDASICWKSEPDSEAQVTITNYVTATRFDGYLQNFDLLIVDESIMVKSLRGSQSKNSSQRAKRLLEISRSCETVWLLSGSPTSRYADDLFGQFRIIEPNIFTSYWRFAENTCYIEETRWGKKIIGSRLYLDFPDLFRDMAFVRDQTDVFSDLPDDYLYKEVLIELLPKQKKLYNQWLDEVFVKIGDLEIINMDTLTEIIRLLQTVANPVCYGGPDVSAKRDAILDMLANTQVEFPLLIWVHWRESAVRLYETLANKGYNVVLAVGDDNEAGDKIEAYKAGQADILILSLGVGKFGHTLTDTRTVIYHDKTWAADDYVQSFYRVGASRRQLTGKTHIPLLITLKVADSVDEMVEDNLAGKLKSIAAVNRQDAEKYLRSL